MNRTTLLALLAGIALDGAVLTPHPTLADAAAQTPQESPAPPIAATPQSSGALGIVHAVSGKLHDLVMGLLHKPTDDPDPSKTLVAPFADSSVKPATSPLDRTVARLPINDIPLDQPHRSTDDLGQWLTQAISETLVMDAPGYNDHLKLLSRGMDQSALSQFNDWVTKSGILNAMQTRNLQMNASVEDKPFLLNEGAVDGRYRWLFEVPVVISFVPVGTTSLAQQNTADSRKLTIRVQIGRVANSILPDHVAIESWTVLDNTNSGN